jgi:fatty acid desaturase
MSAPAHPASPAPAPRRHGYADLAREIRGLGLLRRRPGYYVVMVTASLLALAALLAVMALARDTWWLVLLAPLLTVVSAQISFFGHDVGHRQVTRRAGPSRLLGLLSANLLNGLSYGWWVGKHNAHHAHPNDLEADPDVHAGAVVFDRDQAAARRGIAAWVTRRQAWLFFPMLLLEAVNLKVSSIRAVLRPGLEGRSSEAALLVLHLAGYAGLLLATMTWAQALVFLAVHQGLLGLYLGCAFAPNHKGMPILSEEQATDPLLRQVLTSRNIRGGPVTDLVLGGLNYQIEHHLFPSMPRPHLRLAQPAVRRFCEAHGVAYTETSALASYREVLRHLDGIGQPLRSRAAD